MKTLPCTRPNNIDDNTLSDFTLQCGILAFLDHLSVNITVRYIIIIIIIIRIRIN